MFVYSRLSESTIPFRSIFSALRCSILEGWLFIPIATIFSKIGTEFFFCSLTCLENYWLHIRIYFVTYLFNEALVARNFIIVHCPSDKAVRFFFGVAWRAPYNSAVIRRLGRAFACVRSQRWFIKNLGSLTARKQPESATRVCLCDSRPFILRNDGLIATRRLSFLL